MAECLFHGAGDVVSNICYGKQRCLFTVDQEHFRDPCPPGTKKYITVLYACGRNALISIKIFLKQKLFECVLECFAWGFSMAWPIFPIDWERGKRLTYGLCLISDCWFARLFSSRLINYKEDKTCLGIKVWNEPGIFSSRGLPVRLPVIALNARLLLLIGRQNQFTGKIKITHQPRTERS